MYLAVNHAFSWTVIEDFECNYSDVGYTEAATGGVQ